MAFDQEAWGMVGSTALAQELREAGQRLKWMVSLELLAFTSEEQRYPVAAMEAVYGRRGDCIALVANAQRRQGHPGCATQRPQPVLGCGIRMTT